MQKGESEAWLIAPLTAITILLVLWRRAYTISVQFGYEMWSAEMWHEMKIYLVFGGICGAATIAWAIAQTYRSRNGEGKDDS